MQKEEFLRGLDSSERGLSEAEAARRLKEHGFNEIPQAGQRTSLTILSSKFKSPLVYVLIFASAIALLLGDTTEAVIIVAILLANAVLGLARATPMARSVL